MGPLSIPLPLSPAQAGPFFEGTGGIAGRQPNPHEESGTRWNQNAGTELWFPEMELPSGRWGAEWHEFSMKLCCFAPWRHSLSAS